MAIIPDLSAQDEHITELDGQEYRLRPTLAFLKKVQDVQDAVSSEKFDEAETAMLQALKAGMLWKHTEEEVETLAKSASMAHLIAFISNVADMEAEADKENFLLQLRNGTSQTSTGLEPGPVEEPTLASPTKSSGD